MNDIEPYLNTSLENIEGEEWRDIEDFIGFYQVSNFGRVKSLGRAIVVNNHPFLLERKIKERILKQQIHGGILSIRLHNEIAHTNTVSHLVANAFLKEREQDDYIVMPKNNKYTDLRPANLYWGNGDIVSKNIIALKRKNGSKNSKYSGVTKIAGYSMQICIKRKVFHEFFHSELEAAKKYDYYVKKYKLNRELNFPEETE